MLPQVFPSRSRGSMLCSFGIPKVWLGMQASTLEGRASTRPTWKVHYGLSCLARHGKHANRLLNGSRQDQFSHRKVWSALIGDPFSRSFLWFMRHPRRDSCGPAFAGLGFSGVLSIKVPCITFHPTM